MRTDVPPPSSSKFTGQRIVFLNVSKTNADLLKQIHAQRQHTRNAFLKYGISTALPALPAQENSPTMSETAWIEHVMSEPIRLH